MQYSFNNSRKIPKLAQFIPRICNNFYYKILVWGVIFWLLLHLLKLVYIFCCLQVENSFDGIFVKRNPFSPDKHALFPHLIHVSIELYD